MMSNNQDIEDDFLLIGEDDFVPAASLEPPSLSSPAEDRSIQTDSPTAKPVISSPEELGGAAAIGALAGLAIAGPMGAVAGGLGLATVAVSDEGGVGNNVRSCGQAVADFDKEIGITEKTAAVAAGATKAVQNYDKEHKILERLQEYDREHQVIEKTKTQAQGVVRAVKKFDEKHQLLDKTKNGMKEVISVAQDFDKKHQIVEKTKFAGGQLLKNMGEFFEALEEYDVPPHDAFVVEKKTVGQK
uniref:Uncharacterized protein n=1 Tax=Corethron hystrix TaxID=216773 RepID=A0A7S1FXS1_9STRA|mmetsp:Transcript_40428/g.94986  ORF Transcript_40428/g.94986 Transcript_40428/m.94986 type:complete len:244 (+) Transcript_40428:103-834(+)|eukprot:CAMPEP_0113297492 /NCGR_PEP_ID=MMETSP0010_2-20120614/329_1 /TAXON_ID=216773 ORGANISM="Corethron hystrix, Strain 308" /NCGR_SAMPLE_ID=MMETSP0010_2 /ASSEMBLY_ACC=CAM_ASM_000155 /LENGTH=243 /DNA_ID=CAMNT_0000150385 /DNA_START=64 /DNA_END=795 /DNA_ORIENTATION=- /assembly_acc=CAM_ASM_000155